MNFEGIHPFKKRHEERNYLTCEFQEKHESEYEDEYPLVILDMLFCFTVITSLAIACYRGTWELMDLYHEYFPMWETFFLTIFAQLVFSFSQNFLHDVLIARIEKSVALKVLRFFLSNLYVLVFYVMGVAQLDSVWNILDCYSEQNETLIWLSVISFFLLVLFRGVGNLSSVPACIEMDEEENIFRFNTRYFYKVFFLIISFERTNQDNEATNATSLTKKLILRIPIGEENSQISSPRPFSVKMLGLQPQKFTPKPVTTPPTKKSTTLRYPQLTNYRKKYYPNNIQDILRHITIEPVPKTQIVTRNNDERHVSYSQGSTNVIVAEDVLHRFKPGDPSEINLLATGSVRFSPPAWKDFKKFGDQNTLQTNGPKTQFSYPHYYQFPQNSEDPKTESSRIVDNFDFREAMKKPFMVTLNLYPMESSQSARNDSNRSNRLSPQFHQEKKRSGWNSMIFSFKVYPDRNKITFQ